jgi:hypothetical protein
MRPEGLGLSHRNLANCAHRQLLIKLQNAVFLDVALIRADVSEERIVPTIVSTALIMEAICSSETSVLRRATRRNIPDDAILHSRRRENLKSYTALTGWTL